jgi:hypothetical protein
MRKMFSRCCTHTRTVLLVEKTNGMTLKQPTPRLNGECRSTHTSHAWTARHASLCSCWQSAVPLHTPYACHAVQTQVRDLCAAALCELMSIYEGFVSCCPAARHHHTRSDGAMATRQLSITDHLPGGVDINIGPWEPLFVDERASTSPTALDRCQRTVNLALDALQLCSRRLGLVPRQRRHRGQ